jgi:hypothetical protein
MGFELTTLVPIVVIGTDCTSSCKPNYHTITTTMDIEMQSSRNVSVLSDMTSKIWADFAKD